MALYLLLCVIQIDPPNTDGTVAVQLARPASEQEIAGLDNRTLPASLSALDLPVRAGQRPPDPRSTLGQHALLKVLDARERWELSSGGKAFVITAEPVLRLWWEEHRSFLVGVDWRFLLVAVVWLVVNAVFGNVNASSAHGFYRDRLSKAYLIRRRTGRPEAVEPWDDLRLPELCGPDAKAPYHLINASLNLNGTTDPDVRGRNCDFFVFSKHFTGSRRTGFARTEDLERLHPHLNVGTAVAISGAAAAPNAGVATVMPLVFILPLLDVRLGYWLPNPGCMKDAGWWRRLRLWLGTGPSYLLREAFGDVSGGGAFVNLSDGGHIENLAIYQLLRRRCRLVVAVDGEQDENLRFDGLLRLILFARVDMGIDIEIDLSSIRRQAGSSSSGAHYVVGTIRYGTDEQGERDEGWLLYLKASLTGDEDEVIRDYHESHPAFPHEPTANQFFDERQWEMYRALGFHIADGTFANNSDTRIAEIRSFLIGLRDHN